MFLFFARLFDKSDFEIIYQCGIGINTCQYTKHRSRSRETR